MTRHPLLRRFGPLVLFVLAGLLVLVGLVCTFGTVETYEKPIVQCGGPAYRVMRSDHLVRDDCGVDASDQFWGGVVSAALGLGAAIWGWRLWLGRPPKLVPGSTSARDGWFLLRPVAGAQGVLVVADREVRVESSQLDDPLRLALARIAAAAPADPSAAAPGRLDLGGPAPNLVLTLATPMDVGLADGGSVRAAAIAVAVVGTPDVVLAALRTHGVEVRGTEAAAVQVAVEDLPAARRADDERRHKRRAERSVVGVGFLLTALLGLLPLFGPRGVLVGVTTLGVGLLVTAALDPVVFRWWPHEVAGSVVGVVAALVVPAAVAAAVGPESTTWWVVLWGIAIGVPGAVVGGFGFRVLEEGDLQW